MDGDGRPAGRNRAIQQLRGVAILLVLLQHLSLPNTMLAATGLPLTNPGFVGVELFFLISGHVVARTMAAHGWSPAYFLVRRIFRLLPPLLPFLAVSLAVLLLAGSWPERHVAREIFGGSLARFAIESAAILTGTLLLIPRGITLYVNGAMWSLAVEFMFYAAIGTLLTVARLSGWRDATVRQTVSRMAWLFLLAALITRMLLLADIRVPLMGWLVVWRFDFLFAGVLLALHGGGLPRATPRAAALAASVMLTVVLAVLMLGPSRLGPAAEAARLDGLSLPLILPLLVAVVALAAVAPAGLGGTAGRGLCWIGDRSYTLYLLHFPLFALFWMLIFVVAEPVASQPWTYGLAQLALTLAVLPPLVQLIYRRVEQPCIAWSGRLARGGGAARPVVA